MREHDSKNGALVSTCIDDSFRRVFASAPGSESGSGTGSSCAETNNEREQFARTRDANLAARFDHFGLPVHGVQLPDVSGLIN